MFSRFVKTLLLIISCLGAGVGYIYWKGNQTSTFINQQVEIYYDLYDQGHFQSIYDRLTSKNLRKAIPMVQFNEYLRTKHLQLGKHKSTLSNEWIVTYHFNQGQYFTSKHTSSYERGKSVEDILWVREGRYWKIERLQINPQ